MAGKHLLQGLMKWMTREQWRDRFEEILEDHLLPTCEATGLEVDDIAHRLAELDQDGLIGLVQDEGRAASHEQEDRESQDCIGYIFHLVASGF